MRPTPPIFEPPPTFSDELVGECRERGDPMPLVFEWFKYVGILTAQTASIDPCSPGVAKFASTHTRVLRGLLARSARLALACVRVGHEAKHGETLAILGRCIVESSVKLMWLCRSMSDEKFLRYVADGLKKDLLLKDVIERNIAARDGTPLRVEQRMLRSIQSCIAASGLEEVEIADAARMPDMLTICHNLGLGEDFYTAIQRIGSHAVHGTWTDLCLHYLQDDGDELGPRAGHVRPHPAQLVGIAMTMTLALEAFLEASIADCDVRTELVGYVRDVGCALNEVFDETSDGDYELAKGDE